MDVQNPADFLVTKALDIPEHDNYAEIEIDALQRTRHSLVVFRLPGSFIGRSIPPGDASRQRLRLRPVRIILLIQRYHRPAPRTPSVRQCQVDRDPEDPRIEAAFVPETSDLLERAQKSLLCEIARIFQVPGDAPARIEYAILVPPDEFLKSISLPRLDLFDQARLLQSNRLFTPCGSGFLPPAAVLLISLTSRQANSSLEVWTSYGPFMAVWAN